MGVAADFLSFRVALFIPAAAELNPGTHVIIVKRHFLFALNITSVIA
jgi:hypothetical protein